MIRLTRGDLLEQDDVDALVNAVNCVGVMGKGIALQFKNRWPEMFRQYAAACRAGEVRPGHILVHDLGVITKPQYIISFPTKKHWREASRLELIRDGLVDLRAQIARLKIRSIAIPPLGCGNGGLEWGAVRPMIESTFEALVDVDVRLFQPMDAPDLEQKNWKRRGKLKPS
jgi:O-acetyl-ADP-ribose deacetylase (regulator of RNase III)